MNLCLTASWDSAIRTEITHPHLTQATLVDLRPWKTYNIRMFAVNSVGMSDGSNVLILTTKEAGKCCFPLKKQFSKDVWQKF